MVILLVAELPFIAFLTIILGLNRKEKIFCSLVISLKPGVCHCFMFTDRWRRLCLK